MIPTFTAEGSGESKPPSVDHSPDHDPVGMTPMGLEQITLAQCYEDDYVKYMIAKEAYIAKMEKKRAKQLAKMKANYLAFLKKSGKPVPSSSGGTSSGGTAVNINDVDFKSWMEKNGATDLLKERKERIKQYESQRMAGGGH